MRDNYFTSESVGIGHPDKVCDIISDSILDACLLLDPNSRVAVETMVTKQRVIVAGEITTLAKVNYEEVVRKAIEEIGYVEDNLQFDFKNAKVEILIHAQSLDISQGVNEGEGLYSEQGAGDQGIMFGYATNETSNYMPLAINLANLIVVKARELREKKEIDYLKPDCKSQVTLIYDSSWKIKGIDTIVFSTHHSENISLDKIREEVLEKIIKPVCGDLLKDYTKILINPTGRFVVGGPAGDTGLTGRKIIVDTYGGMGRHGGGAFSGKDPTKVDRSAAYAARYVAKNIVAADFCDRCEIQLSYAIGYPKPTSIFIETFGTEKVDKEKIENAVMKVFDLSPKAILNYLSLRKPIYEKTSFGGHFGQKPRGDFFTWEKLDRVEALKKEILL
jgi:S-adenosylmethionine synthetase